MEHSSSRQGRCLSTPEGDGQKRTYAAAHCFFVNGRLSAAEAAVRRILVLHPKDFDALLLLAEIHCEKDQAKQAEILLRRAVVSKPGSPIAQHRLGVAFQKQKCYEKAARCFRRALALDPCFAEAHLDLGQALYQQQSFAKDVCILFLQLHSYAAYLSFQKDHPRVSRGNAR